MGRITTNKPVSEMNMIELAYNSCYVDEKSNARYRDYDMDVDARDLVRSLIRKLVPDEVTTIANMADEDFDAYMYDMLRVEMTDVSGLIALFYRNLWAMAGLRENLKDHEDAVERKEIPWLPCEFGDTVYKIPSKVNYDLNILNGHEENNRVYPQVVRAVHISSRGYYLETGATDITDEILVDKFYGETWFLTEEEAEAKLKEMEDSHE